MLVEILRKAIEIEREETINLYVYNILKNTKYEFHSNK